MSGAVKAGLIFGAIGLIVVLAVAFIPAIGPLICGPGVAVIIGAVAGYYGVRECCRARDGGCGVAVAHGDAADRLASGPEEESAQCRRERLREERERERVRALRPAVEGIRRAL